MNQFLSRWEVDSLCIIANIYYVSQIHLVVLNISTSGIFILPSVETQRVRRIPYSWPHCYQKNQNYNLFLRLCNLF